GFISELLGRPVIRGFTIGAAAIIVVGQLPKLFGVETEGDNFFEDLASLVAHLDESDALTLTVGAASLAVIVLIERLAPKVPAPLVALVGFIAVSALIDLEAEGIEVVGDIPAGLPDVSLPDVSGGDLASLVPGALALALVAFSESIAIARSVEGRHKDESVDPNKEMIALGVANAGAGMAQSFAVDGSLSRTSVNEGAGARTQLSGAATAILIIVTALALTPLFGPLPEATLGAIVIAAVWHLLAPGPLLGLWRVDRREAAVALSCLLGILVFGILEGILIAVALSFLLILYRAARPRSAELGRVPGEDTFRALGEDRPGEVAYPGLLIFRYDADLFFANASDFQSKIRRRVRRAEGPLAAVIIDAEAIGDIDTTALSMLRELTAELASDGIELVLARVRTALIAKIERAGLGDHIPRKRIFYSVSSAVDAYAERGAARARAQQ
ncbi:MAG: SulP family inorganic anion transporter, partial [Miltoncostaeaceae bacterium]